MREKKKKEKEENGRKIRRKLWGTRFVIEWIRIKPRKIISDMVLNSIISLLIIFMF